MLFLFFILCLPLIFVGLKCCKIRMMSDNEVLSLRNKSFLIFLFLVIISLSCIKSFSAGHFVHTKGYWVNYIIFEQTINYYIYNSFAIIIGSLILMITDTKYYKKTNLNKQLNINFIFKFVLKIMTIVILFLIELFAYFYSYIGMDNVILKGMLIGCICWGIVYIGLMLKQIVSDIIYLFNKYLIVGIITKIVLDCCILIGE